MGRMPGGWCAKAGGAASTFTDLTDQSVGATLVIIARRTQGSNRRYGERAYIVLSLVAKSVLAWLVFAGVMQPAQRDSGTDPLPAIILQAVDPSPCPTRYCDSLSYENENWSHDMGVLEIDIDAPSVSCYSTYIMEQAIEDGAHRCGTLDVKRPLLALLGGAGPG